LSCLLGIAGESAFGDLEDEAVEGEVRAFGGGVDVTGKGAVGELGEGDVDREGEMPGDVFCCGEDAAEEGSGEEAIESGFFREGNEGVREDDAATGMLPARKNFESPEEPGS
jgi:hypothetical protein